MKRFGFAVWNGGLREEGLGLDRERMSALRQKRSFARGRVLTLSGPKVRLNPR
jgi:hypothetical protein